MYQQALQQLETLQDWVRFAASRFNEAQLYYGHGAEHAWDEALLLIMAVLHLSLDSAAEAANCKLIAEEKQQIVGFIEKRIKERIPVAYLTHKCFYAGLEFYVDERVLIPRSPMYELIENQFQPWLKPNQVHAILDLCTGSGCLAITAAYAFPQAEIHAVDLSKEALDVAKINVQKLSVESLVHLHQGHLFEPLGKQKFDVILSNPPYVDATDMQALPQEFRHEPEMALASGADGLDCVREILQKAKEHLNPGGLLIVEVGNSAEALIQQFPHLPFTWAEFSKGESEVFILRKEDLK